MNFRNIRNIVLWYILVAGIHMPSSRWQLRNYIQSGLVLACLAFILLPRPNRRQNNQGQGIEEEDIQLLSAQGNSQRLFHQKPPLKAYFDKDSLKYFPVLNESINDQALLAELKTHSDSKNHLALEALGINDDDKDLQCPISHQIIDIPISHKKNLKVVFDGRSLLQWIAAAPKPTDPITRASIAKGDLIVNLELKEKIANYMKK